MSRDVLFIDDVVVCTDNSVGIGMLAQDVVQVPYDILGYYSARVVLLELLSSGGKPIGYTVGNGTKDGYNAIHTGIQRLFSELGFTLPNVSSSESNFEVTQSSISVTLIGKKVKELTDEEGTFALMGSPLVGDEVMDGDVASVKEVYRLIQDPRVISVLPVGSTGIKEEAKGVYGVCLHSSKVDVLKSSGPSTCVVVKYKDDSVFEDFDLKKLEVA